MTPSSVSFEESGFYSKLVLDYLNGTDFLKPYYTYSHTIDSFDKAIADRMFSNEKRELLNRVLEREYNRLGLTAELYPDSWNHIRRLKQSNTYTLTTGHQLCLLTGPLYFIIKITHVIKLSKELTLKYPGHSFVPMFWMATEDHDFEEVQSVFLGDKKITWQAESGEQPVGKIATNGLKSFFDEIEHVLGDTHANYIQELKSCYLESENLADATHKMVQLLFGKYGIVVLNADQKELKESFIPVMEADLLQQQTDSALTTSNNVLGKKYKLQVNSRETHFFYIHKGRRKLILSDKAGFVIKDSDHRFTKAELESEIEQYPERFSPNVVLRPVYQEWILPNLAYVGGPGELAYWLQLKSVFDNYGVFYPILLARNSFVPLEYKAQRIIRKLQLSDTDLFKNLELLKSQFVQKRLPTSNELLIQQISETYQQLIDEINPINNQIGSELIRRKAMLIEEFDQLRKKIQKAKKQKLETELNQLEMVFNDIRPHKIPAERYFNLFHFETPPGAFIHQLLEASSGISNEVKVLEL